MSNRTQFESTEITAEACAWVAQLSTGELKPADEIAIREWIQRSPRHAAELQKMAKLSMDINVLTDMQDSMEIAEENNFDETSSQRKSWAFPFALASIAMFMVIGAFFLNFHSFSVVQPLLISTTIGEFREAELPDGTLVKINTNTKLEVSYTDKIRKVRLLSGEALFDVKHNPNRPFLVYADEQYVRAVGTAFTVSLLRDKLSVTVVEGTVEFAKLTPPKEETTPNNTSTIQAIPETPPPVFLEVGQHISITPEQPVAVVQTMPVSDLKRELSWQHELFDFSDTPLKEVINELNRYSDVKIDIVDSSLFDIKFGGIFRTSDTKPLFDALAMTYGVNVTYLNDKHVQLSKIN